MGTAANRYQAIKKRGDGYTFVIRVPGPDGESKQQRYTFRTEKEARRKYDELQHKKHTGEALASSKLTVEKHLERWLRDYAALNVDAKTFEDYETVVRRHIAPSLGRIPLEKLRSLEIQRLYRQRQETLSASRVRLIHVVFHQALEKAVKGRLIAWNLVDGVKPPKPPKHRTGNVYDADQVNALLEESRASVIHIAVVLGVHTGMRLGEICALKWEDVDLDAGTVFVHQSLQHTKREGLRFKSTKNEGTRLIRLPAGAISELRRHKAVQAQRRLMLGEFWRDHDLVWPKDDGTPRNPDQSSKTFHDFIIRRTDLPPIRFHDLRHTHATLLGNAKVSSKVVQERLGHRTHAITMDLYTKVFSTAHEEAADAMDRILRKA